MNLDALQVRLLTALADGQDLATLRAEARAEAPDDAVAAWVDGWDPDLLELAGLLVRTWAARD
ncbi:MAG: hypothetical protein JWO60_263 [Frankiales bacterium]|nr:hypothetical protein [Frankiales bacterium]